MGPMVGCPFPITLPINKPNNCPLNTNSAMINTPKNRPKKYAGLVMGLVKNKECELNSKSRCMAVAIIAMIIMLWIKANIFWLNAKYKLALAIALFKYVLLSLDPKGRTPEAANERNK